MTDQEYHQLLSLWIGAEMLAFNELKPSTTTTTQFKLNTQYKNLHIKAVVFDSRPLLLKAKEVCEANKSMEGHLTSDEISQEGVGKKDKYRTWLCNIELDESGLPKPNSFRLAPFIWGMKAILDGNTRAILSEPSRRLQKWHAIYKEYKDCEVQYQSGLRELCNLHNPSGNPVTLVSNFLNRVAAECLEPLSKLGLHSTITSEGHAMSDKSGSDMVGSFVLKDLTEISNTPMKDLPQALHTYLETLPNHSRIDVRQESGVYDAMAMLDPSKFPIGAWPSDYGLAFSQQLAVNTICDELTNSSGILSINGPPGTGKTTLLRDLVAMVVVERARVLASLKHPSDAYVGTAATLIPELQGFSIVVASGNNKAVENVSLELPRSEAVPVETEHTYFSEIASTLLGGDDAWGLLSAKLGRADNCDEFVKYAIQANPYNDDEIKRAKVPVRLSPGEGLDVHLELIDAQKRSPALEWVQARKAFRDACKREQISRNEIIAMIGRGSEMLSLEDSLPKTERELKIRDGELNKRYASITGQTLTQSSRRRPARALIAEHQQNRPSILVFLKTFGRSHREYRERMRILSQYFAEERDYKQRAKRYNADLERWKDENNDPQLNDVRKCLAKMAPGNDDQDSRELLVPWEIIGWAKARSAVFTTALDLHRAFIEATPWPFQNHLKTISNWLRGGKSNITRKQVRASLDALCLLTPVISTTFASIERLFRQIDVNGIGWLLIDEAGQGAPQLAAGAIWRAKRVIVVGDPLQLEPIASIPKHAEIILSVSSGFTGSDDWTCNQSVQTRSDVSARWGTMIRKSPRQCQNELWVGLPLRVHRRCDKPIFNICNDMAYDGLMVYGTPNRADIDYPPSAWLHVEPSSGGMKHWVEEEGDTLKELLERLGPQCAKDSFIITPFAEVENELRSIMKRKYGKQFNTGKVGTVHKAQGQESDVVIFVLGAGVNESSGARQWASGKVNLANVAVSRAKHRLYVIGNYDAWSSCDYFKKIATSLPRVDTITELGDPNAYAFPLEPR